MRNFVILASLTLGTIAFAQSTSQLYDEFLQREQMKLSLQQGGATRFLKSLCIPKVVPLAEDGTPMLQPEQDECTPYEIRNIVELEILDIKTQFLLRDRNGDICFGDTVSLVLRCKNEIGITSLFITGDGTPSFSSIVSTPSASTMHNDYAKRQSIAHTMHETAAIQYLKAVVLYDVRNIIELEILNPPATFVLRDRRGDICFGDISKRILRCKNEMGITGVTFQGDAD